MSSLIVPKQPQAYSSMQTQPKIHQEFSQINPQSETLVDDFLKKAPNNN